MKKISITLGTSAGDLGHIIASVMAPLPNTRSEHFSFDSGPKFEREKKIKKKIVFNHKYDQTWLKLFPSSVLKKKINLPEFNSFKR